MEGTDLINIALEINFNPATQLGSLIRTKKELGTEETDGLEAAAGKLWKRGSGILVG